MSQEGSPPGQYQREQQGRLQGQQDNSAAEAMAILQAMLNIHPYDDITMYCDNQGCVDKAQRIRGRHNEVAAQEHMDEDPSHVELQGSVRIRHKSRVGALTCG